MTNRELNRPVPGDLVTFTGGFVTGWFAELTQALSEDPDPLPIVVRVYSVSDISAEYVTEYPASDKKAQPKT